MLDGEPLAGTPKSRLYLVGDEQQAVLVADAAQPRQKAWRRHHVATLPQHRLHQDGCRLKGSGLGLQQQLQLPQAEGLGLLRTPTVAVGVGIGGDEDPGR